MYRSSDGTSTESAHQHPLSVLVTNFPIAPIESSKVIHQLTRTVDPGLADPRKYKSRAQYIFQRPASIDATRVEQMWRNRDGNVWLVGAWCRDGMMLLEGCVKVCNEGCSVPGCRYTVAKERSNEE
jgi:hypothetical protein